MASHASALKSSLQQLFDIDAERVGDSAQGMRIGKSAVLKLSNRDLVESGALRQLCDRVATPLPHGLNHRRARLDRLANFSGKAAAK